MIVSRTTTHGTCVQIIEISVSLTFSTTKYDLNRNRIYDVCTHAVPEQVALSLGAGTVRVIEISLPLPARLYNLADVLARNSAQTHMNLNFIMSG